MGSRAGSLGGAVAAAFVCGVAALGYAAGPVSVAVVAGAMLAGIAVLLFVRVQSVPQPAVEVVEAAPSSATISMSRGTLIAVISAAVVLRIAVAVMLNVTTLWREFAPDAIFYGISGQAVLDSWTGPVTNLERWFGADATTPFYSMLNAVCLYVFDASRLPLSIFNSLVGIVVAWLVARYASIMYGPRAGSYALLLGLFFPSVVLWSCMNIRDVWSHLLIMVVLLNAHRVKTKFNPVHAAWLLGSIAAMYLVRPYLVPMLLVAVALSLLVVRVNQLPYALFGMFAIAVFVQVVGPTLGVDPKLFSEQSLETVHQLRIALADGGSAYGADVDTRTVAGTLAYLPEGVARFLFAPFPWSISSWRQVLTLPESVVWYYIFFRAGQRVLKDLRKNMPKIAVAFFVTAVTVAGYGLVSGNEGTAYRHRAQVMLIFFVFAAGQLAARRGSALNAAPQEGSSPTTSEVLA